MLDGYPLQNIVRTLRQDPSRSSAAEIGMFFRVLNQKGNHNRQGVLKGTRYVNGELFAQPASVSLNPEELTLIATAAEHDWRKVDPTIFGSLMEGVLGRDRRWELGAHYTHEIDILKIVQPTIIRPWQQRIDACGSPGQARTLLDELCSFRVLDPACGCGNFLYVAYRELRSLEHQLKARITTLAAEQGLAKPSGPWPYYPLSNLQGIDIERIAVLIARVTLWMGHRQMIDRFGEAEPVLPLVDLSSIRVADALATQWPETDAIIGNPPFLGSQWIRGAFGDDYVDWLKKSFKVGVKDLCTYWFRKAHDHLEPGQRAGLVGTNSISQNRARSVSLDYILANGGVITDAVSSQKWPGEAKVHLSLVSWVKGLDDANFSRDGVGVTAVDNGLFILDGLAVSGIDSSLHVNDADAWTPATLIANKGKCFQGPIPVGGPGRRSDLRCGADELTGHLTVSPSSTARRRGGAAGTAYGQQQAPWPSELRRHGACRVSDLGWCLGQAVRLRRGFSPRDARSNASRSLRSSSSSGMDRRSSSMSQCVRTALTFLCSGSGPSTSRASAPHRHSQTDGTSASTENGSSLTCFSGHT